jgi:hypothetical protein
MRCEARRLDELAARATRCVRSDRAAHAEHLEAILKVKVTEPDPDDDDDEGRLPWQRFHGVAANGAVLEAMSRCEAFIFRDSRSQICVRNPRTLEYAVFDDDGSTSIRATNASASLRAGASKNAEELIGRRGWWGQFPPDGRIRPPSSSGSCV